MTDYDPAMAAALDQLQPPPISLDFADRVMAATQSAPVPPPVVAPRPARRGWARKRNWAMGVAGLSLLSAAAAASGVLGESLQNLPVISVIAAQIAPKPKVKPKLVTPPKPTPEVAKKPEPVATAIPVIEAPAPVIAQLPVSREEVRREIVAQAIANRIAKREALRKARGQQSLPMHMPPAARERLAQMPPDERKMLIERIRQIRQEQMSGAAPPPERATIIDRATQIRQKRAAAREAAPQQTAPLERPRWRDLSPEQRQEIRADMQRRRALRQRALGKKSGGGEPTNPAITPEIPAP